MTKESHFMGRKCLFALVFKLISGLYPPCFAHEERRDGIFCSWDFLMNLKITCLFLQTVSHKHDTLGAGASVMFLRAAAGNGTDLYQYWPFFYINRHIGAKSKWEQRPTGWTQKRRGEGFFVPERSQQIVCHNVVCFHMKWNCSAILTSLLFVSFCFKYRVIQASGYQPVWMAMM